MHYIIGGSLNDNAGDFMVSDKKGMISYVKDMVAYSNDPEEWRYTIDENLTIIPLNKENVNKKFDYMDQVPSNELVKMIKTSKKSSKRNSRRSSKKSSRKHVRRVHLKRMSKRTRK